MENQLENLAEASRRWLDVIGPAAWLQALLIVVLSLLAAWIIERMVVASVGRVVSRAWRSGVDDRVVESLRRPLFLTIFFFGLALATYRLEVTPAWTRIIVASLTTIAVVVWLGFAVRFSSALLAGLSRFPRRYEFIQPSTLPLFDNAAKIVLFISALYFVFLAWEINVSALLASAGIAGLALSFAARDALANIFGGMSILADQPFKVGDYITLETGERGEVTHIGLRSTRLMTRDDVEISIPNSIMGNAKIINESGGAQERFRIRIKVRLAYGGDVDQAEAVLLETARAHPEVCATPEPRVRLRGFGDSGLEIELLVWIEHPVDRGRIEHELNRSVYKAFALHGLEIPLPQRTVHVRERPPER